MNFLHGAMILTLAGVFVKILGSVNRILLSRLLGGEGIGLYQMAYPVYLLFTAIANAGVPIAISILIGEKLAEKRFNELYIIKKYISILLLMIGGVLAIFIGTMADIFVKTGIISDERAYFGILAVTPAIFLSMLLGGMRGYFQGFQLMTPTAISQITEQFFRVTFMIVAAYFLLPFGLEYAAAGAAGGAGIGAFFGIIALILYQKKISFVQVKDKIKIDFLNLAKRFFKLAVPISLSNLTIPLTSALDMFLVPHCLLQAGFKSVEVTTMFGYLAGMAQPLILLATIPVTAICFSVVPLLTSLTCENQEKINSSIHGAFKWMLLVTVPAGIGMSIMGGNLAELLYAEPLARDAMMHSGCGIFLLGIVQVSAAILQGKGKVNIPLINLFIGVFFKVFFVLFFTKNIVFCAWGTNLNFAITALLNLMVLFYCGYKIQILTWLKIFASALFMGLSLLYLQPLFLNFFSNNLTTVLTVLNGILIYMFLIFVFKVVSLKEIFDLRNK